MVGSIFGGMRYIKFITTYNKQVLLDQQRLWLRPGCQGSMQICRPGAVGVQGPLSEVGQCPCLPEVGTDGESVSPSSTKAYECEASFSCLKEASSVSA